MERTVLRFGVSLLVTAALSAGAMAQDAATGSEPAPAQPQPQATAAAQAQATAPATEQAPKAKKKHKKKRKSSHKKSAAQATRQAELSAAMAREVEKRKGSAPYGSDARLKDLDRDIENMQRALESSKDEAHKARLGSMIEHLKALRAVHAN
ncbi:MAG: hypothetical protein HYY25_03070 [Candidatus Wallbacteria bacterium]|nr:hypothetical protein [Candidatus Wallbacteria bacterium]